MHSVLYLFPLIRKEGKRLGVHCLSKGFLLFKFSPGTQELEHPPPNPLPLLYYGLPDKNLTKMCIFHFPKITYA